MLFVSDTESLAVRLYACTYSKFIYYVRAKLGVLKRTTLRWSLQYEMKILIQILVIASLATLILTVSLYGDPCEQSSDCDVTGNLQCVDSQCSCESGFTRNSRNTCWRAYGEACEWILDCNVDTFLKCNDTTNTCDCQQPGMIFKKKLKSSDFLINR